MKNMEHWERLSGPTGQGFKTEKGRFRLDIRKESFMMRALEHQNRLPREVVNAPSLEVFSQVG